MIRYLLATFLLEQFLVSLSPYDFHVCLLFYDDISLSQVLDGIRSDHGICFTLQGLLSLFLSRFGPFVLLLHAGHKLKIDELRGLHLGALVAECFVHFVLVSTGFEDLVRVSHCLQQALREVDVEFTIHVDADVLQLVLPLLVVEAHREGLDCRLPAAREGVEIADGGAEHGLALHLVGG